MVKPLEASREVKPTPLFEGCEWSFELLDQVYREIGRVGKEMGLDGHEVSLEVISAEQMIEAYASGGMPIMYPHWSFGRRYVINKALYQQGRRGLAYEIVINTKPCVVYVMEDNTMALQTLVIAHAAMGHNHFFKNNYILSAQQADTIVDYLRFARNYIRSCEERYGKEEVEWVLDAAHALKRQSGIASRNKTQLSLQRQLEQSRRRAQHAEETYDPVMGRTMPGGVVVPKAEPFRVDESLLTKPQLPEGNPLYFLEKYAPGLKEWQREILRIVRVIAQYFYPQAQTQVINEGCATYVHHRILHQLHREGHIDDGTMFEALHNHTNVITQPDFNHPRFSGLNPYALGFAMMEDIERICTNPSDEDREWFPDIAGNNDTMGTLKDAWANYRDESFILQFLSPKVIRDFRLFGVVDDEHEPSVLVEAIHNTQGYQLIRERLAQKYEREAQGPDIQVTDVDLEADRVVTITHFTHGDVLLKDEDAERVLRHFARLWGYEVELIEVDSDNNVLKEYEPIEYVE